MSPGGENISWEATNVSEVMEGNGMEKLRVIYDPYKEQMKVVSQRKIESKQPLQMELIWSL